MCLKKFKIEMNNHKHGNNMEIISNQEFKNPEADINERSPDGEADHRNFRKLPRSTFFEQQILEKSAQAT